MFDCGRWVGAPVHGAEAAAPGRWPTAGADRALLTMACSVPPLPEHVSQCIPSSGPTRQPVQFCVAAPAGRPMLAQTSPRRPA